MKKYKHEFITVIIILAVVGIIHLMNILDGYKSNLSHIKGINSTLDEQLTTARAKIDSMACRIDSIGEELRYYEPPNYIGSGPVFRNITATMYNPTVEQCDESPFITADGSVIIPELASEHKWIAVSRDMLLKFGGPFVFGDIVYLARAGVKSGYYKITDTMNPRWSRRVDILETVGTPHYKFDTVYLYKI